MFCISDDVRWPILNLHCLLLFHFDEPNWISKKDFFASGGVPKRQTLKGGSLGDFGRPGYWRTKVTSGPSSRWLVEGAETCLFFLSSVFFPKASPMLGFSFSCTRRGGARLSGRRRCVGRKEGRKEGSKEARKQGSKEARKQGSKEGRKQGSKEARKQGSKEARKQGSKEARKQGSKEARKQESL